MFRRLKQVAFFSAWAAVGATSGGLAYRTMQVRQATETATNERLALDASLRDAQLHNAELIAEAERKIVHEQERLDGVQRLWKERFRRYHSALSLYDSYGDYVPDMIKTLERVTETFATAVPLLRASEEYEFVSSKIHTLSLVLPSSSSTTSEQSAGLEKERAVFSFLFRGDPIVNQLSLSLASTEQQHNPEVPVGLPAMSATQLTYGLRNLISTLHMAPPPPPVSPTTDIPQLRTWSLPGRLVEEMLTRSLIPDTVGTTHASSSNKNSTDALAGRVVLSTPEDVVEGIRYVDAAIRALPATDETADARRLAAVWTEAAEKYVVREMAKIGIGAFHSCLSQALVLKGPNKEDN
eukprot:PhM_4_TR6456/c0_g1_i1/m.54777